ncbi:MAG: hypothetical protein IAF38_13035, partial [Bacteroidia bacterium]|nr:hypothetical protein [Bacteroidia bacterium]
MKKTTLAIALAFGVASAFAQDLTSKKGEPILPEAGDWSIGIDASPFLNYAGQLLSGSGASSPTWNHLNANQTIIGKMFKDEKTAYRAILRIGMTSNKSVGSVATVGGTAPTFPALPAMVEDEMKSSSNFIGLGAGYEMRRGKTRLQGYYGADLMFWLSGSKEKYTYGNALSTTSGAASTGNSTDFGTNIDPTYAIYGGRVTEVKTSKTFGFGVRGFIGAEYFILAKISIAGEFGWGLGLSSNGERTGTVEQFGGTGSVGSTEYVVAGKSGGFSL